MANRRMFSKEIIDSDMFLDMPLSSQCLYFHLSMRADDDGFVNNPKKIQRMVGASDDDAKILLAKNFILSFESGVIVIKHWKLHNYIQKDRYKPSNYIEEKSLLNQKENGVYTMDTSCTPSIGKERKELVENRKENIVDENEELAKRSIDFLNKMTGKSFKYGKGNMKEILLQIKKGATEEQIAHVIRVKCQEWLNNQDMKKHLNPITLFREANFDKYLNQDMQISTNDLLDKVFEARGQYAN